VEIPETHYATTRDGLSIAYQVAGSGSDDIVFLPYLLCVDSMWDDPSYARFLTRLSRVGRLISIDLRGCGASDPVPLGAIPTIEAWATDDITAVLAAVGSSSATLVGQGFLSPFAAVFAATYPHRTSRLVLINSSARMRRADDYPIGMPSGVVEQFLERAHDLWGTGATAALVAPSRAHDTEFRRWLGRFERNAISRAGFVAIGRWDFDLDIRPILPTIRVPTLVLHHENEWVRPDHGRYMADRIPDARFVLLPGGSENFLFVPELGDEVLDHIEEFVTGTTPVREPDRALATVLFTDIVSSTDHASRLGDRRWTEILDRHDVAVARELERHRGRKVNPTGDGVLATFDGPARAVRCAQAICSSAQGLGIEVRAGLHTGEVELRGDDIGGIAVHIGQRVSALAGPGEVLVSRTVTDLVAGSGLAFEERGEHELKGVPGKWAIYAVRS
jgi:class 3 adenylate cyclase/pimeloyl-ACP methyl ester carboxylesterase